MNEGANTKTLLSKFSSKRVSGRAAKTLTGRAQETQSDLRAVAAGEATDANEVNNSSTKSGKNIHTKGNYSPGEVGGDYKIEQ